eukprot:363244-Pelagomonas_calceolata.AAC.4
MHWLSRPKHCQYVLSLKGKQSTGECDRCRHLRSEQQNANASGDEAQSVTKHCWLAVLVK